MSLRVRAPESSVPPATDNWASRLVKLIPAEALALYGAGSALVPQGNRNGLLFLTAICVVFTAALRFVATKGSASGPQWPSIAIAVVSFGLWVASQPGGPANLGANAFYLSLLTLAWVAIVPLFYKGD